MNKARIIVALADAFGLSISAAKASDTLSVASSERLTSVGEVDSGLGVLTAQPPTPVVAHAPAAVR